MLVTHSAGCEALLRHRATLQCESVKQSRGVSKKMYFEVKGKRATPTRSRLLWVGAPEVGDFVDLNHVFAVPYVEAATLDNRMRQYCSRAARRLVRVGLPVD
jgi:hypothetical protein